MAGLALRLWCEDEGQGLIEYALILVLLSLIAVVSTKNVASAVGEFYSDATGKVTGASMPAPSSSHHAFGAWQSKAASEPGWGDSSQSEWESPNQGQNILKNARAR
jgi:Flp pilus assembly pilin Flp